MQVDYCDLCNQPLKENQYWLLFVSSPNDRITNQNYFEYMEKVKKGTKEICPTCKLIYDEIFRLRLKNLSQLAIKLLGIYELSSDSIKKVKKFKKNIKDEKQKKKKKRKK